MNVHESQFRINSSILGSNFRKIAWIQSDRLLPIISRFSVIERIDSFEFSQSERDLRSLFFRLRGHVRVPRMIRDVIELMLMQFVLLITERIMRTY